MTGGTDTGFPAVLSRAATTDRGDPGQRAHARTTRSWCARPSRATRHFPALPISAPLLAAYLDARRRSTKPTWAMRARRISAPRARTCASTGRASGWSWSCSRAIAHARAAALPRAVARQAVRLRRRSQALMRAALIVCCSACWPRAPRRAPRAEFHRCGSNSAPTPCTRNTGCRSRSWRHARAADPAGQRLRGLSTAPPGGGNARRQRLARARSSGVRETDYLDHAYLVAEIRLVPPAGATSRELRARRRRRHARSAQSRGLRGRRAAATGPICSAPCSTRRGDSRSPDDRAR